MLSTCFSIISRFKAFKENNIVTYFYDYLHQEVVLV